MNKHTHVAATVARMWMRMRMRMRMRMKLWMLALTTIGVVALLSLHSCTPQISAVASVGEDEATFAMTVLATRGIRAHIERVDDASYDVRIPAEHEYDAKYALEDYARYGFERPPTYGSPAPTTPELRARARALEARLLKERNVLHAFVALLESSEPHRTPWAYVGIVYEPIDERGTAGLREHDAKALLVAETKIPERNVHLQLFRTRPLLQVPAATLP